MKNLPQLTVSEFNTESYFGTLQYIDIDILRFIRDKNCTNIVVQILEGENFVYLDEFEPSNSAGPHHNDLLIMAQEWIIKHVKITSNK